MLVVLCIWLLLFGPFLHAHMGSFRIGGFHLPGLAGVSLPDDTANVGAMVALQPGDLLGCHNDLTSISEQKLDWPERSGAEHVIGVQLSIPIAGQQRAVAAKLAVHQLEESVSLNEELILEMRSDLRARLSSWQQGLLALKPRWEAYALHDEAAVRSLRGFALGERSLTEVLQARRVADLQYVQALSQSLELFC
ncbi:MAG: TolC family protein [Betaproteobacteria bacterium]